jgi:hypothetical protein
MPARHSPHFIDEATVRRLLSVAECIASVEEALAGYLYAAPGLSLFLSLSLCNFKTIASMVA